jgi:Ca-activated chloride channel family protein
MTELSQVMIASTEPDPLGTVDIEITLDGFLAIHRVSQCYQNVENKAIEAVFTFPVPYGTVLLGVEAELAGKSLSAVAMPRHDAENAYEDAVSAGNSAIMVEEVSPGLHCVNLGNLEPNEKAKIVFSFGQLTEWRGNGISLRIPTTIAPRYGRPKMRPHNVPAAALDVVRLAQFRVVANGGDGKWRATSPTHSIMSTIDGDNLVVRPEGGEVPMDRDIVINLAGGAFRPGVVRCKDGERHLMVASFQPLPERQRETDGRVLKILIDCSGSMRGDSIHQAAKGLEAILKSLSPADHFSLTLFGSTVANISRGVVQATPLEVNLALRAASSLAADLGGTEMRNALMEVIGQAWPKEVAPEAELLLITDGQSWNDDGIIEEARKSRHRIFSIGVGAAAAEFLLRRLGESTGGACEIVTPRDGMAERVLRQLERMDAKRKFGRIEWPDGARETWPLEQRPVFAGDTVHLAAWFDVEPTGPVRFSTVNGDEVADIQVIESAVPAPEAIERAVTQVVAHGLISETTDTAKATEMAVRYGLLTAHTNLVMVAERDAKLEGLPELRRVPHMVADNYVRMAEFSSANMVTASQPMMMKCCSSPISRAEPQQRMVDVPQRRMGSLLDRLVSRGRTPREPQRGLVDRRPEGIVTALMDAVNRLGSLDFALLRAAGVPEKLVSALEPLVSSAASEGEIVLAALFLALSEPGTDHLPRQLTRVIRAEFAGLRETAEGRARAAAILAAVRQAVSGNIEWRGFVLGEKDHS